MAGWVERQVDAWFDRPIDRYVDKKLDGFLKGKMPYKAVHNGVARLERTENTIDKVARILP